MARRVRDAQLGSKTAREKLKVQAKPYYKAISAGLHIGYRKGKTGGRWVVRFYAGDQEYRIETIADADDRLDANGATILTFDQAQDRARELHAKRHAPAEPATSTTVGKVVEAYVAMCDARDNRRHGREVRSDAARRLGRYVLGKEKRGKQEAPRDARPTPGARAPPAGSLKPLVRPIVVAGFVHRSYADQPGQVLSIMGFELVAFKVTSGPLAHVLRCVVESSVRPAWNGFLHNLLLSRCPD